ncbi:MAG TPA: hypothetical protein PKA37_09860 [Planctomycetota bacterium]|jgi:RNA polymerase sigma factor (sigma-70 family)|nr:hypothetical protein [Planctomycetota bacterium]
MQRPGEFLNDPSWDRVRRAEAHEEEPLAQVAQEFSGAVLATAGTGSAKYGELPIGHRELLMGLLRVLNSTAAALLRQAPDRPLPKPLEVIPTLCLDDLYLAESLLLGHESAWIAFERLLKTVLDSVGSRFRGPSALRFRDDLREEMTGLFYMDDKIRTYRAGAPLEAWMRQVVYHHWQRMLRNSMGERRTISLDAGSTESGGSMTYEDQRSLPPDQRAQQKEWSDALSQAIPRALACLDRDERRMLTELPTKVITQQQLAEELKISTFKMSRWYKSVRERFQKALLRELREDLRIEDKELDHLLDDLGQLWGRDAGP